MKKALLILTALSSLPLLAQEQVVEEAAAPMIIPMEEGARQLTWYEIDPGVRKYLILLTANTMELSAQLPDGGVNPTPEQSFDMMEQVIRRTPMDSLTGEYLQFVTEANELNYRIIATLKEEKPQNHAGVFAITNRFQGEIDALNAKYPQASRYFSQSAQMEIAMLLTRELDIQRVMIQAAMAGKTQQEAMKTVVEHLRYEAEHQF
jgi:hypothetical protein